MLSVPTTFPPKYNTEGVKKIGVYASGAIFGQTKGGNLKSFLEFQNFGYDF